MTRIKFLYGRLAMAVVTDSDLIALIVIICAWHALIRLLIM